METVLIHERIAPRLVKPLFEALLAMRVQIRATQPLLDLYGATATTPTATAVAGLQLADDSDFDTEFIDLIVAVKGVGSVDEAMEHINLHGSRHTDAILTESEPVANQFMRRVDAAGVFWNASTRFADGYR